jgi:RNA polymerase sigma-54 factor
MKQSLQLKLGQHLALTPQLQQAIKLLQLSTLDLQQAIEEALEENPLLERIEDDVSAPGDSDDTPVDFSEATSESQLDDSLPVDTSWEDLLPSAAPSTASSSDEDGQFAERDTAPESLQSHLLWQLNTTRLSDIDRTIALALIDAVDEKGRLTIRPEELPESLNLPDVEVEEVLAVLHLLQHFEPAGLFAQDLRECLLIQLRQLSPDTPHRETAGALVNRHLEHVALGDLKQLARRLRTTPEDIAGAIELIRTLDPTPGSSVGSDNTEYVIPDVFVTRREGRWLVELNPDIAPKLRVNEQYATFAKNASESDSSYIKEHVQEAKSFMKGLQSRNETLLKVASKIVEYQQRFLELGDEGMRPLILADIAQQIEMHESTISRATTRKYMHTPRGVFELKYFFSSHVATAEGGEASSTAIKAVIKKLISTEDPRKPLSDSKLCTLLQDRGLDVARRTVAKYREQLHIPPSNERKRLN